MIGKTKLWELEAAMSEPLAVQQVDIDGALTDMWRSVFVFLPKAVAFLAILFVGWIVARFIRRIVYKALKRVGLDRAIERGGMGRAFERSRYDASTITARIVYYAVLLLVLQIGFSIWGPNPVSDLITSVVSWLPRAFVAIVIMVVAIAIANAVRDLVGSALGGLSYGKLLATAAWAFIIVLGAIAALNQVGIATTVTTPVLIAALATIAGILIVGVGGGLIRPMQRRWEGLLERAAAESQVIREQAHAYSSGREDARRQMADRGEPAPMASPAMAGAVPGGAPGMAGGGQGSGAGPVYGSGTTMGPRADDETQRIEPQQ
jgi:hypothetical protein